MKTRIALMALNLILLFTQASKSQDFTMSQFETHSSIFNPAFIGSSGKDVRMAVGYRNQWFASGYNYQTMLFSSEYCIHPYPQKLKQVAANLTFADDQVGNGQWRNTWISLGGSATKNLDEAHKHSLTLGISGALLLRQFNAKNLLFENQFESSSFSFSPEISSGENAGAVRQGFFQLNSGLMYQFLVSENFNFKTGVSGFWLYKPQENLTNLSSNASQMNRRFTGLLSVHWKINNDLALEPQVFYSEQGNARDVNLGGWLIFSTHIEGQTWHTGGGLFTRLNDSVIPAVRISNGNFTGQFSYDITKSGASKAGSDTKFIGIGGMGAVEFSIIYGLQLTGRARRSFPIPCQTI